jgi:hypothetical protein
VVDPAIVERVACAKYLFQSGINTLDAAGPFSSGLAVLSFHDAAEILLLAIAEHIQVNCGKRPDFMQLHDAINKAGVPKLTHHMALNQLNNARVSFKHHAMGPKDEDARKFRRDLDSFFPTATRDFLGLDYEEVTLADLVQHTRSRNWLKRAVQSSEKGDYCCSAFESAVAFEIAVIRKANYNHRDNITRAAQFSPDGANISVLRAAIETAKEVQEEFNRLDRDLFLIGSGVKYAELRRFRDISPEIFFNGYGMVIEGMSYATDVDEGDASFCSSFVQDTILKIQNMHVTRSWYEKPLRASKCTVQRRSKVIVYPSAPNQSPEVLTELDAGATVMKSGSGSSKDAGFIRIIFEDGVAYISAEDVEETAS